MFRKIMFASATMLTIGATFVGCDMSASTSGTSAAREATAKPDGPSPFGDKFLWMSGHNWGTKAPRVAGSTGSLFFVSDNPEKACDGCALITSLASNPTQKNVTPIMYSYIVTNGIRSGLGATDCNVYEYNIVNGVKVRKPIVCTVGAGWIQDNRSTILNRYKIYAEKIQKQLETSYPNSNKPMVWLLEGDYFQYSGGQQKVYLTPEYLGQLIGEIADTVKKYNPRSIVGFNTSGWYDAVFMANFFRGVDKKNMDFTWVSTDFDSDTIDNNQEKSAVSTITWIRRNSGLPVLLNGTLRNITTDAQVLARIEAGAVGAILPDSAVMPPVVKKDPVTGELSYWKYETQIVNGVEKKVLVLRSPEDVQHLQDSVKAYNETQRAMVQRVTSLADKQSLPARFSDLAPEGSIESIAFAKNTNSLVLKIRALDRDAIVNEKQTMIKDVKVYLQGRFYGLAKPANANIKNTLYTITLSNLPTNIPLNGKIEITDRDTPAKTITLDWSADGSQINESLYKFNFSSVQMNNNWYDPNTYTILGFSIPDNSKANQRVRFKFYDRSGRVVLNIASQKTDNKWESLQIPKKLASGEYTIVMMYNDENLMENYGAPFILKRAILKYDANLIYTSYSGQFCKTNFIKDKTTGYCVAK